MSDDKDPQRISDSADNCEVLRARLAKYEDDQGNPKATPRVVDERAAFQEWYATPEAFKAGDSNGWSGIAWAAWQKRAALSAPSHGEQVRDGWQWVPVEPNEAIRDAINLLCDDHSAFDDSDAFWSYLLAAAPSAGSQKEQE